jgi:glutamate formiminotransferase/formiminotetrahydrofolate cyclodeaminase
MELVECIPNISEGQNKATIEALAEAIRSVAGVKLVNVDIGYAANRTVFTFIGDSESVFDAAYKLYEKAFELIDMRNHKGTHPRMGAVDVCPFVALQGCSTNTLIDISMRLAYILSENLGICGYFYEYSAIHFDRVNLAHLRAGEYESLPEKFKLLPPDFGDVKQWPRFGATVIGARHLLVAYNINLNTKDIGIAKTIASALRTSGTGKEKLPAAKAIGWYIEDFDKVQVSFNLTDLNKTGIIDAFEACKKMANSLGIEVSGSELIGLVPMHEFEKALAFMDGTPPTSALSENDMLRAANYLGLQEVKPFHPTQHVIELLTKDMCSTAAD